MRGLGKRALRKPLAGATIGLLSGAPAQADTTTAITATATDAAGNVSGCSNALSYTAT